MDTKLMDTLTKRLNSLEVELAKVRGVEYFLPFGSRRRARASRKWDMLAMKKMKILKAIDNISNA